MAPVLPTVVHRPMLSLQSDWDEALREKDGTAWVSCKEFGNSSQHGKLNRVEYQETGTFSIQASDGFKVDNVTEKSLTLTHQDPNCKCEFFAPEKIFKSIHEKSIASIDVNGAGLGVSVGGENQLRIWDTNSGAVLRNLEGHVWDIYTCKFFPSGAVVLSSGADMQLKIWSAETGQCPVTLTGHTAAIADVAIVDRGRNVVSASKDGTARLWDCGKASCIDTVSQGHGTINCCALSPVNIDVGQPDQPASDREIATDGKLLLLGCESGFVIGVGLQSRKQLFMYKCNSSVNCCCFHSPTTAAFGTQGGKIYLFDLRARAPVIVWEESASAVLCLISVKGGLFCGRADGSCIYTPINEDRCIQLTGPGFDPVYCMAFDGEYFYTGSRDASVRKYKVPI